MFKSNTPFSPAKFPIFYGWILVPAAIVGILASLPGQTAGFSAFTNSLIEALGISRDGLAFSYFTGTVISGFLLPKAGRLLDQYGTRSVMFVVCVSLGITLTIFSYCESILSSATSIIPFISHTILTTCLLSVLILNLRFFGQGMLPLISLTMINRWFDRKRGKVIALMGVVNSLVFNAAPLLLSKMVDTISWQLTWRYLAIVIGVFVLIFTWAIYRDNPEDCGLSVDGEELAGTDKITSKSDMPGMEVKEAISTLNFKITTYILCLYAMSFTAIAFNLEAIGLEAGLNKDTAMGLLLPVSVISIPVGFVTAWLSDKFSKKALILTQGVCQCLAYLSLMFLHLDVGYYLSIFFVGLAGGMFGPIQSISYPWFFGRRYLGGINGKMSSILVISSAIGPLFFSLINSQTGSFRPALFFVALLPLPLVFIGRKMTKGQLFLNRK